MMTLLQYKRKIFYNCPLVKHIKYIIKIVNTTDNGINFGFRINDILKIQVATANKIRRCKLFRNVDERLAIILLF